MFVYVNGGLIISVSTINTVTIKSLVLRAQSFRSVIIILITARAPSSCRVVLIQCYNVVAVLGTFTNTIPEDEM